MKKTYILRDIQACEEDQNVCVIRTHIDFWELENTMNYIHSEIMPQDILDVTEEMFKKYFLKPLLSLDNEFEYEFVNEVWLTGALYSYHKNAIPKKFFENVKA
jgi:hypothetical protein